MSCTCVFLMNTCLNLKIKVFFKKEICESEITINQENIFQYDVHLIV